MVFQNRAHAGKKLAVILSKYKNLDAVVYALPRGGVVVGAEIAEALRLPLDLVVTRKIGQPFNPEYAIAAVSENGELVTNENEVSQIDKNWFKEEVDRQIAEAKRRRKKYSTRGFLSPKNKIAILVDDGIATGLTMLAAIKELRRYTPKKLIVAVPVSPTDSTEIIKKQVDEFICLDIDPEYLGSVGAYYSTFAQVEDEEVIKIFGEK
jgi:predicted phosphoribosyltransferase